MGARPFAPRASQVPSDSSAPVGSKAGQRSREAAALLLFALAGFSLLALGSYERDPHDPSLAGGDWAGAVGAAFAGFLVQGFGAVAWLLPLELVLLGLPLLRGQGNSLVGLRLAGDLVVGIVLASLVQVVGPELKVFGHMAAGGNVGLLFGELMRGMFSTAGSLLVGSTVIGLILVGRNSVSFIAGCRRMARALQSLTALLHALLVRIAAAWSKARIKARIPGWRRGIPEALRVPVVEQVPSNDTTIAEVPDPGDPEEDAGLNTEAKGSTRNSHATPPAPDTRDLDPWTPTRALVEGAAEGSPEPPFAVVLAEESPDVPVAALAPETPSAPCTEGAEKEPLRRGRSRSKRAPGPTIVDTTSAQSIERGSPTPRLGAGGFRLPSPELLESGPPRAQAEDEGKYRENALLLEKSLADFGVTANVARILPGPTVTTYEVVPKAGTKVSKITALADDLALGLSRKVRIKALPEKGCIGFELPNDQRPHVYLRDLVEHKDFARLAEKEPLPVVLGLDPVGTPFYADLTAMPHVIVAGATGAGKSVGLNVMLVSLLLCRGPDELRLLMVDPKVVELAPFDGIPHLLLPVVTDMKQAATALKWAVDEMERRYQLFADAGTKNVTTYNAWVDRVVRGEVPAPELERVQALTAEGAVVSVPAAKDGSDGLKLPGRLPYIVVVVDEFADLMMQQGKEVEVSVARLAQKARAAGIHVILATQRPSVDVITGMIKANFPSRIAYRVAQKVDSRTILDEQGAEMLLGRGDMLVKVNGKTDTVRVQCPFVSEDEVNDITEFLRQQGTPQYHEDILTHDADEEEGDEPAQKLDPLYDQAVCIVAETQRCSTSWLQRKMSIGYNRAAKIVESMERRGVVGPANGIKDREVLVSPH